MLDQAHGKLTKVSNADAASSFELKPITNGSNYAKSSTNS